MKKFKGKMNSNGILIFIFVMVSLVFYSLQLVIFQTPRDTLFYFIQDLAFMPFQVILVTLVLNRWISARERRDRLKKMNMAISAFFGEAGTEFLLFFNRFVMRSDALGDQLAINGKWNSKDFAKATQMIRELDFITDSRKDNLEELKALMLEKRPFLLSMLDNSNLLEHDTFTEMLWAVFHIMDELVSREKLTGLPEPDMDHLSLDIKRAYKTLLIEWIHYIAHLKTDYPYLFSMAVRKNPFDEKRSVVFNEKREI